MNCLSLLIIGYLVFGHFNPLEFKGNYSVMHIEQYEVGTLAVDGSDSQSVSGTLDRPRVVAPSKTCGHGRSFSRGVATGVISVYIPSKISNRFVHVWNINTCFEIPMTS